MDDDGFDIGLNVWGTSETTPQAIKPPLLTIPRLISPAQSTQTQSTDDDFDDFSTPLDSALPSAVEADDDFGDFGDFGDVGEVEETTGFEGVTFDDEPSISTPGPSRGWEPLDLDPMPSIGVLRKRIDELVFNPLWGEYDPSDLSNRPVKEGHSINSILLTPESRQSYKQICSPHPPQFKPLNWTRSKIRRQHLISMGIPVNLDEVEAGPRLPTLQIRTRPASAPPEPGSATVPKPLPSASRVGTPRPGTPRTGTPRPSTPQSRANTSMTAAQLRLGPRPELDEAKVRTMLDLRSDDISLQSVSKLESHLEEIQSLTIQTSSLLTYLLQFRDALQQDSETFNKLIAEMVSEAQKIKSGKRTGRRGSGM